MSEIQEQMQRHIETLIGTGAETGLQAAVYRDGALIVDAVAGTADPATGRQVTSGTPIFSFSAGKNVSATIAHLLVARGFLDYDSAVTDLWPEFGVHGKATATLRHVLTHTVGLPAMPRNMGIGTLTTRATAPRRPFGSPRQRVSSEMRSRSVNVIGPSRYSDCL